MGAGDALLAAVDVPGDGFAGGGGRDGKLRGKGSAAGYEQGDTAG